MCASHWNKLPTKLKQRWWDETEYGIGTPSDDLIAKIIDTLELKNAKPE
jgi:hypothetical protein